MIECTDNPPDRVLLAVLSESGIRLRCGEASTIVLKEISWTERGFTLTIGWHWGVPKSHTRYHVVLTFSEGMSEMRRSASFQHPNVSNIKEHNRFPYNNLAFLLTRALLMIQYSAQCELLTKKHTTFLEMAIEKSNFFLKGAIL